MITIVAKNTVNKDYIHEFIKLTSKLIEESRKENGCKMYHLYQDNNNKNILTFIEKWENEESIRIHNESIHFKKIVPKLNRIQEKDTEVNLYKEIE
ncbi:quinol monooxygenase YgiN [Clostridium algifaecis]|uniref:Quinol monooxygenase YgiN n=1 Tax=Clostridium algifaecis TaxID=1472040 RepID=A0ABS4KVB0_9CLOT|nr:putative quinol monooxygenase [Clostridium algifaecis]MBP2033979.1 quinol monooxygenase YgiN [Clostridium algifaecis]